MSGVGLVGSSSTGKTTLALAVSEVTKVPFIQSQVRAAHAICGISPEIKATHSQKMKAQNLILNMAESDYKSVGGGLFITDRTPIDFMTHVLAEVTASNLTDEETDEVMKYCQRCYDMTNLYFASVILTQPAIAVIAEAGRTTNPAYIQHINLILTGLVADSNGKLLCAKHFINKNNVNLQKRIKTVVGIATLVEANNMNQKKISTAH